MVPWCRVTFSFLPVSPLAVLFSRRCCCSRDTKWCSKKGWSQAHGGSSAALPRRAALLLSPPCPTLSQPRARERSAAARCSQNVTAGSPHPSPRRTLALFPLPFPRPLAPSPPRPHPRVLAPSGGGYSRGPAADPPPSMRSPHSPAVRHVRSLPETVAGKRRGP